MRLVLKNVLTPQFSTKPTREQKLASILRGEFPEAAPHGRVWLKGGLFRRLAAVSVVHHQATGGQGKHG
jgi:hypothetical protein